MMKRNVYPYLCLMMFLQFAVYGLWLPIAGRFLKANPATEGGLGFSDAQAGWIIGLAASIGAICSPIIVQTADRRWSAQRVLGVLMIGGGIVKLVLMYQTSFEAWLILSIFFALMFMPATAICNALAMRHLKDPTRHFAGVRLWSAIGWISVAWFFPLVALKTNVEFQWLPPFFHGDDVEFVAAQMLKSVQWSGTLAIGYGLFAFFVLPDTPPIKNTQQKFAVIKAFGMLKHPSVSVMLVVTLMLSILHVLYFIQTSSFLKAAGLNDAYIMPAMSVGQIVEVMMYAFLGRLLSALGFRATILLGTLCFVARFCIYGTVDLPVWCQIVGQAFHGFCYAFFFGACFIYMDRVAPPDVRNSAQSVYNFVFYGLGPLLAVQLNSFLANRFSGPDGVLDLNGYRMFWYSAAGVAAAAAIVFAVFFRDETIEPASGHNQTEN